MAKPPRPWIVTRHDPLEQLDDNLWAINGDIPGFPPNAAFPRRMSIARLSDGRLLFFNAVPVDEPTLAQIRALGTPSLLLVPHHLHAMDAPAFRDQLALKAYTAAQSIEQTRARLPIDGPLENLPRDSSYSIEALPSSRFGEAGLVVNSGPRKSLVVCDIVINVAHGRGLPGLLFRLGGFTGPEPKMPLPVRLRAFKGKAAVRRDLLRLAELPGLVRVVPSHGPVIADGPAALRRMAERL